MVKVKICGNKRAEDVLKAVEYGADAVGLLVGQRHHSTDFVAEDEAAEIVRQLPPFVSSVLVTHLSSPEEVITLARKIQVSTIQLHGETTPKEAREIKEMIPGLKTYKAIHVTGEESIEDAKKYVGYVDAILLDTVNLATDQVGGTGKTHDWSVSAKIVRELAIPVILAGGLNLNNIREAIEKVQPYGVDVNSGVKAEDGYKDIGKLSRFISIAKSTI